MTERQRLETTYADLRPDDQIEDKSGNRWGLKVTGGGPKSPAGPTDFMLCDLLSGVPLHSMSKHNEDPVAVWRLPKHADQVAQLEAEFPADVMEQITANETYWDEGQAVETVTETLGATVDLEATAQEIDAAIEAEDTGLPIEILAFEDMTDLEKRSHLYVLHGVYSTDLQSRAQLTVDHSECHDALVNARTVPHTHLSPA